MKILNTEGNAPITTGGMRSIQYSIETVPHKKAKRKKLEQKRSNAILLTMKGRWIRITNEL